jgi:hypothetical protein
VQKFTPELQEENSAILELVYDTSNSLVSNIYAEMRKMKFVDVASSLNFLLFIDDERKVNKFIERLSTMI